MYTETTLAELEVAYRACGRDTAAVLDSCANIIAVSSVDSLAARYLAQGVMRRLKTLYRALWQVYQTFPPERVELLAEEERLDVAIALQASTVNVFGVLDNIAWVVVHDAGGLAETVKSPHAVGLFRKELVAYMSPPLRSFVDRPDIGRWYAEHLKEFRDAIAHRLPVYLPPYEVAAADMPAYEYLQREAQEALISGDAAREQAAVKAIDELKRVSYRYGQEARPDGSVLAPFVHAQLVADIATVLTAVRAYVDGWLPPEAPVDFT